MTGKSREEAVREILEEEGVIYNFHYKDVEEAERPHIGARLDANYVLRPPRVWAESLKQTMDKAKRENNLEEKHLADARYICVRREENGLKVVAWREVVV